MTQITYAIGHEALEGKFGVPGMLRALKKQPFCAAEILIAGLTEALETKPNSDGAQEALKILRAAAKQLDGVAG